MTSYDSPLRPLAGANRPAWLDAPHIVVPSLLLTPSGPGEWTVQFMFPARGRSGSFSWLSRRIDSFMELNDFLTDWWTSPEEALRKWFSVEPPKGRVWALPQVPEDHVDGESITIMVDSEDL